jgi:HD-GYP domain-containing protein (c-di-GMP phosphodiesterase class II)
MQGSLRFVRFSLPALGTWLHAYVLALWLAASGILVLLVAAGHRIGSIWPLIALALLGAVAERSRVRFSENLELSISLVPSLFAAVTFGPLEAMLIGAASLLGDFRRPYLKWAVYTPVGAITGAASGLAALGMMSLGSDGLAGIAVATCVAAFIALALDTAFASLTVVLRRTGSGLELAKTLAPVIALSVPLYTPIVALLSFAYGDISPWTLPLFLVPAIAAQRLFGLYQDQRRLADDLSTVNNRLERANLSFASALVATLDARDEYTAGHSAAVAIYSRDIARRMGLPQEEQQKAHLCGLVHDIGKIGLAPGLLEKPGALTLDERRHMQEHSAIGERILANVEDYADIARIVRHHHERVDGQGYPDGLSSEEIPQLSRIIAVADAYNAMTSDRPYRDAMPSRVARLRLAQAADTQFDTGVVAAFEALLASSEESYRLGLRDDFMLTSKAAFTDEAETQAA